VFTVYGYRDGYIYDFREAEVVGDWPLQDSHMGNWSIDMVFRDDNPTNSSVDAMPIIISGPDWCTTVTFGTVVTKNVNVHNLDPVIAMAAPAAINEGGTVTVGLTISDPGVLDTPKRLTVDWGDGTATTRDATNGDQLNWGVINLSHVYLDDAPTSTPQDNYTITATITDDDNGTATATSSLTVNNVAPTVAITSITPIDSVSPEQGGVDGRLDETEGFVVRGTVTDPGVLDTFPVAKLDVDLNFDGLFGWSLAGGNESFPLTLVPVTGTPGAWTFERTIANVQDDGLFGQSWPSNGTPNDPVTLKAIVTDDDTGIGAATSEVLAHNIAPKFVGRPTLLVSEDALGDPVSATLSGTFEDPGTADQHSLIVKWGGQEYVYVLPTGTRSFDVHFPSQWVLTWGRLGTVEIVLDDNDTGTDRVVLNRARIVAKSFINDIYATGGVGQFPNTNTVAPFINLALNAFAVATNLNFLEDPIADDKDGKYRLFTRVDVQVFCEDGQLVYANVAKVDTDAGAEPNNMSGTIALKDLQVVMLGGNDLGIFWQGEGTPDPSAETAFEVVAHRSSRVIWHMIGVGATCNADDSATFGMSQFRASDFPSHRVWINQVLTGNIVQGPFVSLWRSDPNRGPTYVTEDGTGPFAIQQTLTGPWDPNL